MTNQQGTDAMNLKHLRGLHSRLERELSGAFRMQPLPGARIERLVQEIAATARAIDSLESLTAQPAAA